MSRSAATPPPARQRRGQRRSAEVESESAEASPWPALLDVRMTARYVSLGVSTVWSLVSSKQFPPGPRS
jgi:hypothetical protein